MRTRRLAPSLLAILLSCAGFCSFAQVPVKLFTANDGQTDNGTAVLVAAIRKQLADMPQYKLWQGQPAAFPKKGLLIDVQGIDILDADDAVVGSAVFLVCSTPAAHDAGAYRLLYRELIEVRTSNRETDDQASDFLQSLDHHMPAATASALAGKQARPKTGAFARRSRP
jgi:hypothetical protein